MPELPEITVLARQMRGELVGKTIASGTLYQGDVWRELLTNVRANNSTLHFIGLFSDGNVHSNIAHLEAMLRQAKAEGVKKARIHPLIDGRDVPPTSALEYVERFDLFLHQLNGDGSVDYCVASGGGRMNITMDRYNANWSMVERGWNTHVRGEGRRFSSMREKRTTSADRSLVARYVYGNAPLTSWSVAGGVAQRPRT